MVKMSPKTIPGLILLFLASQPLSAQTPAVPIEQEPRHRIVFQNKNVRIYDALIPPGDLTLFHTHAADNVSVVVSGGQGTNEFEGRPPTRMAPRTGAVSFSKATNAPYTHRVGNVGTTALRFVVTEVLASAESGDVPTVLDTLPGHKLELDNDLVRVYRVVVDPKKSTGVRSRNLPWLSISLSESTISIRDQGKDPETVEISRGHYRWHEGATAQSLENIGSTSYEAIEIELK